jgi:hypothetical protein
MQVFVPYPDIRLSVAALDPKRLGNQIYRECLTLIRGGWPNHPASRAWTGHFHALALYSLAGLDELDSRGRHYPHHRATFEQYLSQFPDTGFPKWWGREDVHRSHASNLLRKDPAFYGPKFPGVPADLPYIWPTP